MQRYRTSSKELEELARFLRILSNSLSLGILTYLLKKPMCVCELVTALGHRQPCISQHLIQLRKLGIVKSQRDGWNQRYFISSKEISDFMSYLISEWQSNGNDLCQIEDCENE
ncbi:MAG: helix-turn-helix transcriptional regulator [Leptolinea sp.]|jgi:DNA-binding transcriptional ArsR family regulator|nr:helix-turn-helix transcriptional regulator [Leptolinea sp.]